MFQEPESHQKIRKVLSLMKMVSQGEEDIKNGQFKSQEDVFAGIDRILKEKFKSRKPIRSRIRKSPNK